MGVPTVKTDPMTVAEFYGFTDARPDTEKWELIEGEPVLQASSTWTHNAIMANLIACLDAIRHARSIAWKAIPGIGLRLSPTSRPEPDVMIVPLPRDRANLFARDCADPLVVFEILSPSTADRDLRWKRTAYTSIPALTHYVVIAQDAIEVVVFARDAGFAEQRLSSIDDVIAFPALGVTLPLAEIYRDTGLPGD